MELINIIDYIIDFFKYLFNITEEDIIIHNKNIKERDNRISDNKKSNNQNVESTHKLYFKLNDNEKKKKYELLKKYNDYQTLGDYKKKLPYVPDEIEFNILKAKVEYMEFPINLRAKFGMIIAIKIALLSYLFDLNDEEPYYSRFIITSNPDNLRGNTNYETISQNMDNQLKELYSKTYDPTLLRLKNNNTLDYYLDNRHSYQKIERTSFENIKKPCDSLFLYECYKDVYLKIIKNIFENKYDTFKNFYDKNNVLLHDLTIPQCYIPFLNKNKEEFEKYKKHNSYYILPELCLDFSYELYDIECHIIWLVYINIKIKNTIQDEIEKNNEDKDYKYIFSYIVNEYERLLTIERDKNKIYANFGYNKDKLSLYKYYLIGQNENREVDNNLWLDDYIDMFKYSYELFVNNVLNKMNINEIKHLTNKEIHNKINEIYLEIENIKKQIVNFDTIKCDTQEHETKKIIRNYIKKILKSQLKGGKKKKTYKKKKKRRKSKKKSV